MRLTNSVGTGLIAVMALMTVATFAFLIYDAATTKLPAANHRPKVSTASGR